MSDHDTAPQQRVQPDPDAPTPPPMSSPMSPYASQVADRPPYAAPYAASAPPRLSDLVLGLRGVIAVAIASLIVGGIGGWAIGASTNDNGNTRGGFGGPGQFQRGNLPNRQFPGQRGPFTGQQGSAPNNSPQNQPNR